MGQLFARLDEEWQALAVDDALAEGLSLVFPTWCAGCDQPDVALCEACRRELAFHRLTRRLDRMPVISAAGMTAPAWRTACIA